MLFIAVYGTLQQPFCSAAGKSRECFQTTDKGIDLDTTSVSKRRVIIEEVPFRIGKYYHSYKIEGYSSTLC